MASISDWRDFFDARILQESALQGEKGADEKALVILERLCANNPDNSWFLRQKAWAISVLKRDKDETSSTIEATYRALHNRLSGPNDDPGVWVTELEKLKAKLSDFETKTK